MAEQMFPAELAKRAGYRACSLQRVPCIALQETAWAAGRHLRATPTAGSWAVVLSW